MGRSQRPSPLSYYPRMKKLPLIGATPLPASTRVAGGLRGGAARGGGGWGVGGRPARRGGGGPERGRERQRPRRHGRLPHGRAGRSPLPMECRASRGSG